MELRKITWDELFSILRDISKKLRDRKIDVVVGIGVSGLIPAIILRRLLGVNDFYVVIAKHYSDEKPPKVIAKYPVLVQTPDANVLRGKRILIVDDFVNTGETLRLVKEFLIENGALEVVSAVIVKRGDRAKVDVYGIHTDHCVAFPWELI